MTKPHELARSLTKALGKKLEEHRPLRDLLPLPIGGVADFYTAATTVQDLIGAIQAARVAEIDWLVIGTGTQTVISDFGFPGLVIHNQTAQCQFVPSRGQVLADSGVAWPRLVLGAVGYDLGGAEACLLVPGSLGAALVQDRVAPNGQPIRSFVREVTLLNAHGTIHHLSAQQFYAQPRQQRGTVLVATLQMVHSRHDEVIRRISVYERQRRQLAAHGQGWLGPVFGHELGNADPTFLPTALARLKILGLAVGGAVFSASRPNFIEARGRVTAHDIRELILNAQHILGEQLSDPPLVQLRFAGTWHEDSA